jgi:DNA polymerase
MVKPPSPADTGGLPTGAELDRCRRCELWQHATQGVPGDGSPKAVVMLVGEQPGDEEDRAGRPFVGPAGKLLSRALSDAGFRPADIFVTNAVKHFSFELRGKRRIHKTPTQRQVAACQHWLEREIAGIHPRVIVALGATALAAVMGKTTRRRQGARIRAATARGPARGCDVPSLGGTARARRGGARTTVRRAGRRPAARGEAA